jgi:hypothetical protein
MAQSLKPEAEIHLRTASGALTRDRSEAAQSGYRGGEHVKSPRTSDGKQASGGAPINCTGLTNGRWPGTEHGASDFTYVVSFYVIGRRVHVPQLMVTVFDCKTVPDLGSVSVRYKLTVPEEIPCGTTAFT